MSSDSEHSSATIRDYDPDMPATQARMGKVVPNFWAMTTDGKINLHEWLGESWGIVFSHPAPFTPICTSEMGSMAAAHEVMLHAVVWYGIYSFFL